MSGSLSVSRLCSYMGGETPKNLDEKWRCLRGPRNWTKDDAANFSTFCNLLLLRSYYSPRVDKREAAALQFVASLGQPWETFARHKVQLRSLWPRGKSWCHVSYKFSEIESAFAPYFWVYDETKLSWLWSSRSSDIKRSSPSPSKWSCLKSKIQTMAFINSELILLEILDYCLIVLGRAYRVIIWYSFLFGFLQKYVGFEDFLHSYIH